MGIEGGSAHLIGLREHNSKRKSLVRLIVISLNSIFSSDGDLSAVTASSKDIL